LETKYSIKKEDLDETHLLRAKSEYYKGIFKQSLKKQSKSVVQNKEEISKLPSISREVSPGKDAFHSSFYTPTRKQGFAEIFSNSDSRIKKKDKPSLSAYKNFSQQIEKELSTPTIQNSQEFVR